ncbi:MAG: membrane protein insertase YidC, partial [Oscillospiraceae bacterium]|nr:membrane protein insertase YidC [Oscillospiraceae bacterium]
KIKALEAKYKDDKDKYNAEVQKLYKAEGVSPMSGCLWTLIPLVIMLIIYAVIRNPLTHMFQMPQDMYNELYEAVTNLGFVYKTGKGGGGYEQIAVAEYMVGAWDQVKHIVAGVLDEPINFNVLGVDIGQQPKLMFWNDPSWPAEKWNVIGRFLIPFLAGGSQMLSSFVSQKMNQSVATNDKGEKVNQTVAGTKAMLYTMPIISIWFAFVMPAGIGVYWIFSALFGMIQDAILTKHYRKKYDAEDAIKRAAAAEEAAKEAARQAERERRAAEGIKELNPNTSKKKLAAQEKIAKANAVHEKPLEKMSPKELAEYWAKVAAQEEKKNASPTGDGRKYSRGRNYDPERRAAEKAARAAAKAAREAGENGEAAPVEEEPAQVAGVIAGTVAAETPAVEAIELVESVETEAEVAEAVEASEASSDADQAVVEELPEAGGESIDTPNQEVDTNNG